ncbi:MAG: GntR family transcriptional regulator [Alphaproteobacteria bacterium]|nr:GntR family transcriptional regulator [Alphaproteobacteria bacterium]
MLYAGLPTKGTRPMPQPAAKRLTSDDIVFEMIKLLQKKVYQPGDRLREQELATRFGVSRGPIREALRALEAKSLIKIEPMRGASVTRLSDKDAIESVEISATLFGLAANKAAGCEQHFITKLRTQLKTLNDMVNQDTSAKAFFLQTIKMGMIVVKAAGSDRLAALLSDIRIGAPDLFGPFGFTSSTLRKKAATKWARMIDAIESNDVDAAERIARELNMDSLKAALEIVG